MSTARERREKRRQQAAEHPSLRPKESRQVRALGERPRRRINLLGKISFSQWWLFVPAAIVLAIVLVAILRAINPPAAPRPGNAIWLDRSFSYSAPTDNELAELVDVLKAHQIGTIYLYASSMKADATWSGAQGQNDRFIEVEPLVKNNSDRLQALAPQIQVLAWIEVTASLPEYRLNSPQVRASIRDFAGRMVNGLGFEGVMLDIKPVANDNPDLPIILREVRAEIGLNRLLAVAVPADLTPLDTDLALPPFIAPGTLWSADYKRRVSIQADQMVVSAYNSYIADQVEYIRWVAYQVDSFTRALTEEIPSPSQLLIGIPNYTLLDPPDPNPHIPIVETLAGALDGVAIAVRDLSAAQFARFTGVAIFTDRPLTAADWALMRQKYLDAPLRPLVEQTR
ncbi:hypothetical protein VZO05_02090 [Aggregatilineales bacterium SYSU G02658]